MTAQSDALQWAKNNPGTEATAHLLSVITAHEATIAHLREVNKGHVKGLGTMRKRVRAARAETEALRLASVELHPTSVGTVVVRATIEEPLPGPGRHRSIGHDLVEFDLAPLGRGYPAAIAASFTAPALEEDLLDEADPEYW